jgi:ssDNA thymidine ADP-ribosyltransferase, DarT
MALSSERAIRHVTEWSERLKASLRCGLWPAYLFHAAHVTTAAAILRSGRLSCRSGIGTVAHDVANQGALHNNPRAHDYARLYFRPRNAFHFKTEGVKCLGDPYRDRYQMSIPVLLAFDSVSVLTLGGVGFSPGMLSRIRGIGHEDRFFDRIPFDLVYHDGPVEPAQKEQVQDHRMAEVVVPRELPLAPHLRKVFCRTFLERRTLLHLLGADAQNRAGQIEVQPRSFVGYAPVLDAGRARSGRAAAGLAPLPAPSGIRPLSVPPDLSRPGS